MNTPRGLRTEDPRVRQAFADAVQELRDRGLAARRARSRAVQNEPRGEERIPIHGGPGEVESTDTYEIGEFNVILDFFSDGDQGADVDYGSSYVQAVQFVDGACPVEPRTILTYSQSANPESPFFADQTRMFSNKRWVDVPFCRDEVRAATLSTRRLRSADVPGQALEHRQAQHRPCPPRPHARPPAALATPGPRQAAQQEAQPLPVLREAQPRAGVRGVRAPGQGRAGDHHGEGTRQPSRAAGTQRPQPARLSAPAADRPRPVPRRLRVALGSSGCARARCASWPWRAGASCVSRTSGC
ncbi:MAG: penicillin acylase family protein [Thermoleophilaceae bacterium]